MMNDFSIAGLCLVVGGAITLSIKLIVEKYKRDGRPETNNGYKFTSDKWQTIQKYYDGFKYSLSVIKEKQSEINTTLVILAERQISNKEAMLSNTNAVHDSIVAQIRSVGQKLLEMETDIDRIKELVLSFRIK